jgi:hypothetical protein
LYGEVNWEVGWELVFQIRTEFRGYNIVC